MAREMPLSVDSSLSSCSRSLSPSAYVPVTTRPVPLSSDQAAPSLKNATTFKLMSSMCFFYPPSLLPSLCVI